jgi:hypothetical protein
MKMVVYTGGPQKYFTRGGTSPRPSVVTTVFLFLVEVKGLRN